LGVAVSALAFEHRNAHTRPLVQGRVVVEVEGAHGPVAFTADYQAHLPGFGEAGSAVAQVFAQGVARNRRGQHIRNGPQVGVVFEGK
nr:hypothetical protein [Tanacetum cinerariifolium]